MTDTTNHCPLCEAHAKEAKDIGLILDRRNRLLEIYKRDLTAAEMLIARAIDALSSVHEPSLSPIPMRSLFEFEHGKTREVLNILSAARKPRARRGENEGDTTEVPVKHSL